MDIIDKYKLGNIIGKGSISLLYNTFENDKVVKKICNREDYDVVNEELETSIIKKLRIVDNIEKYILLPQSIEYYNEYIIFTYKKAIYNLYDYFKKNRKIIETNYLEILYIIVYAVEILHNNRIVHCDLKLENILIFNDIDEYYHVNICDFNLSLYENMVIDNQLCTVTTRPPEWHFIKKVDYINKKSDVFSLGIIVIEVLFIKGYWYHINFIKEYKHKYNLTWEEIYLRSIPNSLYTDRKIEWSNYIKDPIKKIQILTNTEEFPNGWLKDYIIENCIYINKEITERILKYVDNMISVKIIERPNCNQILKYLSIIKNDIKISE